MRKILTSLGMVVFAGAVIVGATGAFFSDTETSEANIFRSGGLDLTVDSEAHYAGLVCDGQVWIDDPNDQDPTTRPELVGGPCDGTWALTDLGPQHLFFNLSDLKPGDEGENTFSLHLDDNPGYVCAIIDNVQDVEVSPSCTEPESEDGDTSCTLNTPQDGELADELHFFAWSDMYAGTSAQPGDNIWQPGQEDILFTNTQGPASDILDGVSYELFGPPGPGMQATTTQYIGLYWCYGEIVGLPNGPLTCDGQLVTNVSQTDQLSADITFYAEQARNNGNFQCPQPRQAEQRKVVGAALGDYQAPGTCTTNVSDVSGLVSAVDTASTNDVICVNDGDYDLSEPLVIDTEGLTLASVSGPTNTATITGGIFVDANDVTITGFVFDGFEFMGASENAAIYIHNETGQGSGTSLERLEISYNIFNGPPGAADSITTTDGGIGSNAIINEIANSVTPQFSNSLITHNVFDGWRRGVFLNPSSGIEVSYNDFYNNLVGSANDGPNSNSVHNNDFEDNSAEDVGVNPSAENGTGNNGILTVNTNNFAPGGTDKDVNWYGFSVLSGADVDATGNWWDGDVEADRTNVPVEVDTSSPEGAAFPEN